MNESLPAGALHPLATPDEEAAAIRAAQCNPSAFAGIYHQFVNPVFSYLYSRLGDRHEAEDITSQVFLEALEGLPRYRFTAPFAAWIFTIARRRVIDHLRKNQPLQLDVSREDIPSASPDPLAHVIRSEELHRLLHHLTRLDGDDRELLRLRFAAALSYEAIAAIDGRSPAAIKMHVHRLVKRLETQMEVPYE